MSKLAQVARVVAAMDESKNMEVVAWGMELAQIIHGESTHRCPTCSAEVRLIEVDEGTSWYLPVEPGADGDATNMAVAIKFALMHLPEPEDEPNDMRAAGIGALRGALDAHYERVGA